MMPAAMLMELAKIWDLLESVSGKDRIASTFA
jgi:hypothetical protein